MLSTTDEDALRLKDTPAALREKLQQKEEVEGESTADTQKNLQPLKEVPKDQKPETI